jgi:hypothetical protein
MIRDEKERRLGASPINSISIPEIQTKLVVQDLKASWRQ